MVRKALPLRGAITERSGTPRALRAASLGSRGVAGFIDLSVLGCGGTMLVFPVVFVLGYACFFGGQCAGEGRERAVEIAWGLAAWLVPSAYFLIAWSHRGGGQTVGMRAARIQVVGASGEPPGLLQAAVRLVVLALLLPTALTLAGVGRLAEVLSPFQGFGLIALLLCVLVRRDRRGPHDLLAGTTVVVERRPD